MKPIIRAYFDLGAAMAIVGSSVVFGKTIVAAFPVFLASGLRFAIAGLLMAPIVFKTSKDWRILTKKDWCILVLMALTGQVIFTVLLLLGLKRTSAVEAGIITSLTPAAMAAVSWMLLREKLNPRTILGIALAVLGVLAVNGLLVPSGPAAPTNHLWGNLLVLGAVMGEAFFLLLRKTIPPSISSLTLSGLLSMLGFIMFLPLALWQAVGFDFSKPDLWDWGAIAYFGAVFTVVAYILWFRGVAQVKGTTAGAFSAVMPVSAVILSTLFLGETFTWTHALGILLVLGSIGLLTREPKKIQDKEDKTAAIPAGKKKLTMGSKL
jgi:drug/metabolite transporter (DMT)-like permease